MNKSEECAAVCLSVSGRRGSVEFMGLQSAVSEVHKNSRILLCLELHPLMHLCIINVHYMLTNFFESKQ